MKQPTIILTHITKEFSNGQGAVPVLKDISFNAHENELLILMGPSGSGKTTLISIIGGILDQDSGDCLVLGKSMRDMPSEEKTVFRGTNIGFMFQQFMLIPTLDGIENAAIPLLCMGDDRTTSLKKAEDFLTQLDLKAEAHKYPNQLSGGEQQRVAIARACLHNPKIILCDEPTSFLDSQRGKMVMEILRNIKEKNNCTVIVITHDPRILEYADTVIRIEDGKIMETKQSEHATQPSDQQ